MMFFDDFFFFGNTSENCFQVGKSKLQSRNNFKEIPWMRYTMGKPKSCIIQASSKRAEFFQQVLDRGERSWHPQGLLRFKGLIFVGKSFTGSTGNVEPVKGLGLGHWTSSSKYDTKRGKQNNYSRKSFLFVPPTPNLNKSKQSCQQTLVH